ncbi:dihydroorotase, mitochondrial [Tanacetum coccineum]
MGNSSTDLNQVRARFSVTPWPSDTGSQDVTSLSTVSTNGCTTTGRPIRESLLRSRRDVSLRFGSTSLLKQCEEAIERFKLTKSAKQFGRAIIMPNLKPPVTTTAAAVSYRDSIMKALQGKATPTSRL